jgi:hypothetical protein
MDVYKFVAALSSKLDYARRMSILLLLSRRPDYSLLPLGI